MHVVYLFLYEAVGGGATQKRVPSQRHLTEHGFIGFICRSDKITLF